MIVPVMAISNLVLTQQIYSEETNGAHAHYREPVPLSNDDGDGNENGKKSNKFMLAIQQLCTCITLYCTLLSCR